MLVYVFDLAERHIGTSRTEKQTKQIKVCCHIKCANFLRTFKLLTQFLLWTHAIRFKTLSCIIIEKLMPMKLTW